MLGETKEKLKDKLLSGWNNFTNAIRNNKSKVIKYISLAATILIVGMISKILGFIVLTATGIHFIKKHAFPVIKGLVATFKNNSKPHGISNKINRSFRTIKTKLLSFCSNDEKAKKECTEEYELRTKNTIHNKISNLKVATLSKFKSSKCIKKDILGVRIVNGEYKLKAKQIIQDNINLNDIKRFRESLEQNQQKIKVR